MSQNISPINKKLEANKIQLLTKKRIRKNSSYNNIKDDLNNTSSNDLNGFKSKDLKYDIDSWFSFVNNFHPKNILTEVGGILSKWSAEKSKNEFVTLKLEKTSIVSVVTFGKYKDPTNLKEFRILAGLDKSNMIEILHSGLNNDNEYESFTVNYTIDGIFIPCK
jgi:hypothetical protein